jgi:predicted TIM-barrel fold metal-dependent hydrolase
MSASAVYGKARACAGIVGFVDLRLGEAAAPVLEAQIAAGGGRFRGVRHLSTWDADDGLHKYVSRQYPRGLLLDSHFRLGFSRLAPLGLSFDALLYFHQLEDLVSLSRAFPETTIVLNHLGFPIGVGPYAGRRNEVFDTWKGLLRKVAGEENVVVKLGGLGMPLFGFGFHTRVRPAGSNELARAWRPYIETCIDLFGSGRCMFESNFPMDRPTCSYDVLWNTFKCITQGFTTMEKADLFYSTAARIYRLEPARSEVLSSTSLNGLRGCR